MAEKRIKIYTDGGTSSNIPPFGIGYGSFRIGEDGEINRLDFKCQMSSNAAEIYTMAYAIQECSEKEIDIFSDSRIGLNWVKKAQFLGCTIPENISEGMKRAILFLIPIALGKNIKTHWRPREQIFKIFGH